MDVHHPYPQLGTGGYRLGNRVGNVVKLQIQKHVKALGHQLAHELGAKQGKHLLAHLEAALGRGDLFNEGEGIGFVLIIQRDQYFGVLHVTSYGLLCHIQTRHGRRAGRSLASCSLGFAPASACRPRSRRAVADFLSLRAIHHPGHG
ncbi:hypothetical protein D3C79_789500 [compost metagenome]